jgi:hypothetical protein
MFLFIMNLDEELDGLSSPGLPSGHNHNQINDHISNDLSNSNMISITKNPDRVVPLEVTTAPNRGFVFPQRFECLKF